MKKRGGIEFSARTAAAIAAMLFSASVARAETHYVSEKVDRVADGAALSAKLAAVHSIEKLLSRPGHEDRAALLNMRLAETLQEISQLDYRIRAANAKTGLT